jgi:hypothetical protein
MAQARSVSLNKTAEHSTYTVMDGRRDRAVSQEMVRQDQTAFSFRIVLEHGATAIGRCPNGVVTYHARQQIAIAQRKTARNLLVPFHRDLLAAPAVSKRDNVNATRRFGEKSQNWKRVKAMGKTGAPLRIKLRTLM